LVKVREENPATLAAGFVIVVGYSAGAGAIGAGCSALKGTAVVVSMSPNANIAMTAAAIIPKVIKMPLVPTLEFSNS